MRRHRLAAAAVILGIALAACGGATTSDPPSASSSDVAPTGAPSASATSAASPSGPAAVVPQLPIQRCCAELALEPGGYALPGWLGPLLTLEITDEWGVINDASARYLAFGRGENSVGTMATIVTLLGTPSGSTASEVADALRETPGLTFSGEPTTVLVAGFDAMELVATAEPNPDRTDDPEADIAAGTIDIDALEPFVEQGFQLTTATPEARLRFLMVEVDDRVLVVWIEAPAADSVAFFADADTLLGTLERQ